MREKIGDGKEIEQKFLSVDFGNLWIKLAYALKALQLIRNHLYVHTPVHR